MDPQFIILFSGQTDAGKSTIIGHLLYKYNYEFTNIKNIEESTRKNKWSSLLDIQDVDEIGINKNKTVIFKSFDVDIKIEDKNISVQIIDTPGHQIYIRQLIEGLFRPIPIHVVCIVVSSITSEFHESFDRGTVREDLLLAKSAGIANVIVLWNKMDIQPATDDMKLVMDTYCKQLKFKTIIHHHVSGYYGDGLDKLVPLAYGQIHTISPTTIIQPRVPFPKTTTSFYIKVLFVFPPKCNLIISAGFLCMLHCIGGEFEIVVVNMKIAEPFIRATKPPQGAVDLLVKISSDDLTKFAPRDRIVLRKDKETIGFGIIC